jgi:predicted negative regulator of RcsB-dependent stress response
MQTQDAPAELLFKLWPWLEANKNRLIAIVAGVIVLWGVFYFISAQRQQKEINGGLALTQLLVNPAPGANDGQMADALAQVAASYPGTVAGQRAQLQAAAALFDAGRYAEAQTQFQNLVTAHAVGPLAATAQLGVAASLEAQNQLDQAAAAYQKLLSTYPDSSSALAAEFALGRVAEQQNKLTDAASHYDSVARASQAGSLAQEAAQRAFEIKNKIAATPKPTAALTPVTKPQ